ncbi:MAG: 4a-hydroxytetrahydrobiopterin dehydratase [Archangiaceae bacterium]|nr:4a-hydroxytetrahydrobiopterin dehydratase [Archangiaceae bacterium]
MARDQTKLTPAQIDAFLNEHPLWRLVNDQLERTYEWPAFLTGIAFVSEVARLAEAADHHPDIDIRWRKVTLRLTTHDAHGITARDTELAAKADAVQPE